MNGPGLRRGLKYLRMAVDRRRAAPVYLVVFVNGVCHARCLHCFLGSLDEHHTARPVGLSVSEMERLAGALGPSTYSVLFAGGEPFMRKDLGDILEAFSRQPHLGTIKVVSNGYFTDRLVTTWERILALETGKYYGATLSFDGVAERHDRIRGVPGIFARAVESFERLQELARRHPNFEVDASVTVSHFNQDHLGELYTFLRDSLHAGNVLCTLTRGKPKDPRAGNVDVDNYLQFRDRLADDLRRGVLRGQARFGSPQVMNAVNSVQRERIGRMLTTGAYASPCNAGRLTGVIGSDGKVYACELRDDCLGDLRQQDFDLDAIWRSPQAAAARTAIHCERCFCTYENANLLNVVFSPRYYPQLLLRTLEMQARRLWVRGESTAARPGEAMAAAPRLNVT